MLYKRGTIFWYKFQHEGLSIRESAKTSNKADAEKTERRRHSELDQGAKVKRKAKAPLQFAIVVKQWLALKRADWSVSSAVFAAARGDAGIDPIIHLRL